MQTIVVASQQKGLYRAHLEDDPDFFGNGRSGLAAVGNLIRCNSAELQIDDDALQVHYGEPWEEMSDREIGQLVQERGLVTIKIISSVCN